jgi:hypothetical protein
VVALHASDGDTGVDGGASSERERPEKQSRRRVQNMAAL